MSWEVIVTNELVRQVLPLGDSEPHDERYHMELLPDDPCIHPVSNCKCHPEILQHGNAFILVHSAFDGRLGIEWANELLK